jgi:primosomal protein N' (replication factor Y)
MYIITVIPFYRGNKNEYLSYFSSDVIPIGTIVSVPFRKKEINALVIDNEEAKNLKTDLKNSTFQLRKVIEVKGKSPFNISFFNACQKMAQYTVSSTGLIIKNLLPSVFITNIQKLNNNLFINIDDDKQTINTNIHQEKLIFQANLNDRLAFYRTLIREAFAKKESIFICLPTHYDIKSFFKELSKGIEQYVYIFHSSLNKKELISNYNMVMSENHPILIIGTGIFMSIDRHDLKTIIVENESSDVYKQMMKPYIDIRSFAEVLSSIQKIKLIFSDSLLRPETLYRHESGDLGEIAPPSYRLSQPDKQIIIDMKNDIEVKDKKKFKIISEQAKNLIIETLSSNQSVFLFSIRKGLAPITVCNDCGHTLLCPLCTTPIVLYGTKQISANKSTTDRIFMCNKCGHKEKTEISCPNCSSWNLTPLGIGIDKVYEEIKTLFPKTNIIQIDKETTKTKNEALNAITLFKDNPDSILIGTEMALSYLEDQISTSIIVSLDGLFSIPNFNMTQKILHIIEKLNQLTQNKLLIQTRNPLNQTLQYITSGNVLPLCRLDQNERKKFNYPPYKRLIKITFEGTAKETEKARELIENIFGEYEPQIFSAFISKVKGQYITNTVIKIDCIIWPLPIDDKNKYDQSLNNKLRELPLSFLIDIDPEDLL